MGIPGPDQHDPATWNREQLRDHAMKELNGSGMVEAYHNQTLWDNRQTPAWLTPLSTSGTVRTCG
jgi:hypothetical protein